MDWLVRIGIGDMITSINRILSSCFADRLMWIGGHGIGLGLDRIGSASDLQHCAWVGMSGWTWVRVRVMAKGRGIVFVGWVGLG